MDLSVLTCRLYSGISLDECYIDTERRRLSSVPGCSIGQRLHQSTVNSFVFRVQFRTCPSHEQITEAMEQLSEAQDLQAHNCHCVSYSVSLRSSSTAYAFEDMYALP